MNGKFGLIGESLKHSFSPLIHRELGDYPYELCSLKPDQLTDFIDQKVIQAGLYAGLNVTIPYKQEVLPYCQEISKEAAEIGCVNTLIRTKEGGLKGYNTDAFGFIYAAKRSGIDFTGKKVAILGSGGTSLTVLYAAKKMGAKEMITVSRSGTVNYEELKKKHTDVDLIVNTTPVGMFPQNGDRLIDLRDFPNCCGVFDVIYNPFYTALLLQAMELNIPCSNGLPMLVAQAAKSAEYFTGKSIADERIEEIHSSLRKKLLNVVLIGMPGSGKTSVGSVLAEQLNRNFLDTDQMVVTQANSTIDEIFQAKGEETFRKIECEVIRQAGKRTGNIIATGGGAILNFQNYLNLKQNGILIFIQRDIEKLPIEKGRPLSKNRKTLNEMYKKRLPLYLNYADEIVDNRGSVQTTVDQILTILGKVM